MCTISLSRKARANARGGQCDFSNVRRLRTAGRWYGADRGKRNPRFNERGGKKISNEHQVILRKCAAACATRVYEIL